ncbi:MAG: fibronectin type III domain-containing protein [Prevotella sp.]|jgi:hypothetical protein|nr:fibronectin type III domain-containing protein [Prevotella sp.]
MKNLLKIKLLLLLAITNMCVFTACDDDDLGTPDRLFRPVVDQTVSGTWIKLEWERYAGTLSYTLQLSESADFATVLADVSIEETEYTFEGLEYNTQYYIRIRGVGDGIESAPIVYDVKTNKYPTKILSPASNDYIDTQVRMRWEEETYDSMRVFIGKEYVKTVILTTNDNDAKTFIVTDLEPSTTYTVKAYRADNYLGEMDYKTTAAQVFEGDYVDLRLLDDAEAYTTLTQTYFDELAALYPNGVTVVLNGATKYEIGTINLSASTKFVTGLSFLGGAVMEVKGSFAAASGADLSYVSFDNVIFTDHSEKKRDTANFGGCYLFNFNQANGKVGDLSVLNCDIRYKRGVLRAQVATEIGKITFDNCLIDSIGGYGLVNADHAQAYFNDIVVKNTTMAHAEKILVATKPDRSTNAILMENMTVCYAPKGEGNYIIDFNNQAIPGGITIKNCIFGAGWGSSIRGIRSNTTNILVEKSYRASDATWSLNATSGEPYYPITDLELLTETTDDLFTAPNEVNFKLKKADFVGKIGDPRWW